MSDVLLLTVDSLRADYFTEEYFPESWPFFEREFNQFTNAYSHGVATPFAFPGIICGYPPRGDGTLPESPTLAELAKGRTVGYANNPHLQPDQGYDRGFSEFSFLGGQSSDGHIGGIKAKLSKSKIVQRLHTIVTDISDSIIGNRFSEPYRSAEEQVERVKTELDDVSFCWAHFQDPHFPFSLGAVPDRNLSVEFDPDRINHFNQAYAEGDLSANDEGMETLCQVYEENIKYLDRQLANLLETLDRKGWFDEGVVALTADHGEAFGEEGMTNHPWNADPIDALVRVPLLLATPDASAGHYDNLVQHADLFQSLAGYLTDEPPRADFRHNLRIKSQRHVLSMSNIAIQCITSGGSVTRFRDGQNKSVGNVDEGAHKTVRTALFPSIKNPSRSNTDVSEDNHKIVEERLSALGYTE